MRSFVFPSVIAAGTVVLALGLMLASLARNLDQLEPLRAHIDVMQRVQTQSLAMQYALVRSLRDDNAQDRTALSALHQEIGLLINDPALLTASARRQLRDARSLFDTPGLSSQAVLRDSLTLMHEALAAEGRAHNQQLVAVAERARLEYKLTTAALVLIVFVGSLGLFLLRRRILDPLRDLDSLMQRLSHHDFARVETRRADSLIAPLLDRYNDMVARLAELEAVQAQRQASLEQDVRNASRELIAHNRSLAEADKLASIGELAASVAHELRNPMAGIQLAVANLRHDLPDGESRERLDAVIAELRRMTGLMNALLDRARHVPEPASAVELAKVCGDLLALVRYQIEPDITLAHSIDPALVCLLPPDRLRQALLNLVLNAAQVMPGRGTIHVSAVREDDRLALSVEDSGPGFSEAMLTQGITRFASQRPGGSGLGLATVRRFALDLGGTLTLDNFQPHGARVTLRLPCPSTD